MADDATLTNNKTTFDADTNPDISVRATEKAAKKVQHVIIDWGGTGAESTTVPTFTITQAGLTYTHTRPSFLTATSTTVIAANASRKDLKIANNTQYTFFLRLDGGVAVADQGYPLGPGTAITVPAVNAVTGIQSSGGTLELDVDSGV